MEDGCLWKLGDAKSIQAWPQVECVTKVEAREMAWKVHWDGGHFHHNM